MAFKLTKDESAQRDKILAELNETRDVLEAAISAYNSVVEEAKPPVEEALEKYNAVVERAQSFAVDIANQAETDIDEKSEAWQESERGEAAVEWKDEWLDAEFSAYELEFPDELQFDQPDHAETLEGLPEAADA